jgi:HK97 family phage prohead protease
MPDMPEHIEDDAVELIERVELEAGDGRTIRIRLVKWGEIAETTPEGIRETFARGAFADVDPTRVTIEAQGHKRDIAGKGFRIEETEDGAYLDARINRTTAGNDLLELINDRTLGAASVVFRPISQMPQAGGVIARTKVDLARVAILDRGAYPSAAVIAVREQPIEAQEAAVSDEQPTETTPETPAPTPEPVTAPESPQEDPVPPTPAPIIERSAPVDLSPITSRIDSMEQRMTALAAMPVEQPGVSPELQQLLELHTFGAFVERALAEKVVTPGGHPDPDGLRYALANFLQRTVADQITSQNDGVNGPAWVFDVKRIVDFGRPAINALGGAQALPPSGMELDWPYVSSANVLIAAQATQKTEVQSARVDIGKGTAAIGTYAGVSDISVQLLKRSRPDYRAAYDRIMLAYWARVVDAAFAAALLAAGTAATIGWDADTTGQNLKEALFSASVQVESATGLPATAVLCATDVFTSLGKLTSIVPATPTGNPSNAAGTLHGGTLQVSVAGLPLIHVRGLATGNVIVTNQQAAQWFEDGPWPITADDASLLGTDVAWYSFGAAATFVPAGIVKLFGPGASGS